MEKKKFAPIVLFTYNRLDCLVKVVNSLKKNSESKRSYLYIFSDGAKNNEIDKKRIIEVRKFIRHIKGFKRIFITENAQNQDLSINIINGVTKIFNKFNKAIIIEDDIQVSRYFLQFMNDALDLYKNDKNVASIHGYQYPILFPKNFSDTFFLKGADCWGWATWKRAWSFFEKDSLKLYLKFKNNKKLIKEFNYGNSYNFFKMLKNHSKGKVNSWAIRWYASTFLRNMYTLYPKKSYVKNLGFDYKGTHPNNFFFNHSELQNKFKKIERVPLVENELYKEKLKYFFKRQKILRLIYLIKYLVIKKVFNILINK